MKINYTTLLLLLLYFIVPDFNYAQTGPAGVGSSATNKLWLDASDLTHPNNTLFYNWFDRSGNNNTAVAQYPTTRPLLQTGQVNGLNAVNFDGINDYLRVESIPAFSSNPTCTYIFVQRNNNTTQTAAFFTNSFGNNSGSFQAHLHGGTIHPGLHRSFARSSSGSLNFSSHTTSTNFQINTTITSSSAIRTFSDGVNTGNNVTALATPVNHKYFFLGARPYLNDLPYNGKFAEVLAFSTELGTAQRTIVENYLSTKYNIAIANDKYSHEATGHTFEMAGIGQENGNTNADAQGAGLIRINNASAFANNTYLLWAHNNSALTAQFIGCPATYPSNGNRITRTWRSGVTNNLGTVTIEINLSGIEFGDPTSYELLIDVDNDGDFSNAVRHTTGYTYNAGVITFTGVTLADGNYFTIGNPNGDIISITTGPWSNPSTWNCNCVPNNDVSATIMPTHNVTVNSASSINTLRINTTGALTFSGSSTLTIEENLIIDGTINGSGGTVLFAGTAAQTVSGTGSATYQNLTLNNNTGLTFTGATHSLTGALTLTAGALNVNGQSFTLVSDATATARIAPLGATGSIVGSMNIQRFIGARADGYSDMSSSVQSATFADWADDFAILFAPYVPFVSIPSAWGYSESAFDYYAIEASTESLVPGEGYEVYLDNDGSTGTSWSATQLMLSGTPNQGNVVIGVTVDNDGWNLVGNPYASFISFSNFRTNSGITMSNFFLFYDETINDFAVGGIGASIAASQGFWIECTTAGAATFREVNKTTATASTFRNVSQEQLFGLRLRSENINAFTSNTYFRLEEGATTAYELDHDLSFLKVPHPGAPALYTHSSDGKKLRINELSPDDELIIPVSFTIGISGYYVISAEEIDQLIESGYHCVFLEDKRSGKLIDLAQGNYHFYADINEKADRFVLRISKNGTACRMASTSEITLAEPNGVEIVNNANGLFVNFKLEEMSNAVITVVNPLGQQLINPIAQNFQEQSVKIYLPGDYQGIYLITVQVGDKRITRKFFH